MAAPTLQAEGTGVSNMSGDLQVTMPPHLTNDIIVLVSACWLPNSSAMVDIPTPSGGWWTAFGTQLGEDNSRIAAWWTRATGDDSVSTATFTRPAGANWDTGVDTNWHGRAYVIRGAATSGDPWDETEWSALHNTASGGAVAALTVSGTDRLAMHFEAAHDNWPTTNPTISGWTAGTIFEMGAGTDSGQQTFRKDGVSASTSADTVTQETLTQGHYAFLGISFKSPTAAGDAAPVPTTVAAVAAVSEPLVSIEVANVSLTLVTIGATSAVPRPTISGVTTTMRKVKFQLRDDNVWYGLVPRGRPLKRSP